MLLPDKIVRYKESVISKFVPVLQILQTQKAIMPEQLYKKTKDTFSSFSEFIQTLDALYAIGTIDTDKTTGEIICL